MAVFFLLLAVLLGVVLGDALVENESTGAITLFGQSTDQFTDGQLLLGFAGLGILFALLLVLSVSSTRRRRARRKERRTASRELEDRATQLERDNARLRTDLGEREEALAGREAELAHRDRQLALKDEELARHPAAPGSVEVADTEVAQREEAAARREDELPRDEEELGNGDRQRRSDAVDRSVPQGAAVMDHASSGSPEVADRSRPEATEPAGRTPAEPTEVADRTAPIADTPPEPTEVLGRPAEPGRAGPTGGEQSSAPLLSPVETEPVAPLHDEPPWEAPRSDERTRPVSDDDAAGGRASQTEADTPTEHVAPDQSRAEAGPVDGLSRSDEATEQDSADAADDERTRPVQRPDRNA
jgi:hypothetical protein